MNRIKAFVFYLLCLLATVPVDGQEENLRDFVDKPVKNVALVIGVSDYTYQKKLNLGNPILDAQAVRNELSKDYGYEIIALDNPSRAQIMDALVYLKHNIKQASIRDTIVNLLIYIAAHGDFNPDYNDGYIIPADYNEQTDKTSSCVTYNTVRPIIDDIAATHIIVMLDVCRAGTFDPNSIRYRGALDEYMIDDAEVIQEFRDVRSRKFITSSGSGSLAADGSANKNSPFAAQFLRMLRAHYEQSRMLTATEFYNSIENLSSKPCYGSFGSDAPTGKYLFVPKNFKGKKAEQKKESKVVARAGKESHYSPNVVITPVKQQAVPQASANTETAKNPAAAKTIMVIPRLSGAPDAQSVWNNPDTKTALSKVREYISDNGLETVDLDKLALKAGKSPKTISEIKAQLKSLGVTTYVEVTMDKKQDGNTFAVTLTLSAVDMVTDRSIYFKTLSSGYFETDDNDLLLNRALSDNGEPLINNLKK